MNPHPTTPDPSPGSVLLPCPFCGKQPDTMGNSHQVIIVARCRDCDVGWRATKEWNTRASVNEHAAQAAELERCRKALRGVLAKFEEEYQALTDGQYGTTDDFTAIAAARRVLGE